MSTPSQAYDHKVVLVSGPIEPHTLQYGAALKASETFNAGALVVAHTDGTIMKGGGATVGTAMPMWAINGTSDLDVTTESIAYALGQNVSGGYINCYVATGGYELFTSEYDDATGNTYNTNTYLTPATGSDAGEVTVSTANYSNNMVCGVVSRGVVADQYSKNVLYFWPVFLPVTKTS